MRSRHDRSPLRARRRLGFTLIEVLIALSLLSILMVVLTGAMRAMGQTEERVDQRIAQAEDYRLAWQFLNGAFDQVSARRVRVLQAALPPEMPFFLGDAGAVQWIGIMPARFGVGGRHYLRLAVETVDGQSRWVLRYAPWNGAATFDQWGAAAAQPLASATVQPRLSYRHPASGAWLPAWPPTQVDPLTVSRTPLLPDAVRIDFGAADAPWPPMVLPVSANFISDPSAVRSTFGGGSD